MERHLIGCPGCRDLHRGSERALSILRSLGGISPVRAEAPSVWPALARQIRESRHVPARSPFFRLPEWPRLAANLWPVMGLALGLGAVVGATLSRGRDLPRPSSTAPAKTASVERKAPALSHRSALPGPDRTVGNLKPAEPPSTLKFDYDLDHGTPLGPIARESLRSY